VSQEFLFQIMFLQASVFPTEINFNLSKNSNIGESQAILNFLVVANTLESRAI